MDAASGRAAAWIDVISDAEAKGLLKELYDRERVARTSAVDNIMMIHSLHPETMHDHSQLYRTLMYGKGGLSRAEREMIGTVVSAVDQCFY